MRIKNQIVLIKFWNLYDLCIYYSIFRESNSFSKSSDQQIPQIKTKERERKKSIVDSYQK
jgi:hypothetical protein